MKLSFDFVKIVLETQSGLGFGLCMNYNYNDTEMTALLDACADAAEAYAKVSADDEAALKCWQDARRAVAAARLARTPAKVKKARK